MRCREVRYIQVGHRCLVTSKRTQSSLLVRSDAGMERLIGGRVRCWHGKTVKRLLAYCAYDLGFLKRCWFVFLLTGDIFRIRRIVFKFSVLSFVCDWNNSTINIMTYTGRHDEMTVFTFSNTTQLEKMPTWVCNIVLCKNKCSFK